MPRGVKVPYTQQSLSLGIKVLEKQQDGSIVCLAMKTDLSISPHRFALFVNLARLLDPYPERSSLGSVLDGRLLDGHAGKSDRLIGAHRPVLAVDHGPWPAKLG